MLVIILFLFFRKMYERTFFRFKSKGCCNSTYSWHTTILFQWENFVRSNHNYKKDIFYKLHMLNIKKILIEMR